MSDSRDIVYAVVGCGFGVWSFFWGFKRLRRKRKIENVPTSTVRSLAMGLVELIGKPCQMGKIKRKAPITNTDCVAYKYIVQERRGSGKHSRWVTIAQGNTFNCPFWLDDGTGRVMIMPKGAELIMPADFQYATRIGRSYPPNLISFLEKNGIRYRGLFGRSTMSFQEWHITENDKVYLLGTATNTKVKEQVQDHRAKLQQRLKALKNDSQAMEKIDLNNDGEISTQEWDKAVAKIEKEILEEELSSASNDELADVIIGKGKHDPVLILSDYSQKELLKKLGGQAFFGIYGGAVLAILLFLYLLVRFGVF